MQKRYKPNEISARFIKYIDICTEAKSIFDRYFEEDDYFFLQDYGVDKVDKNLGDGFMFPSDPEFTDTKIKTSECVWLPTLEQIEEKIQTPWPEGKTKILEKVLVLCKGFSTDEWPLE